MSFSPAAGACVCDAASEVVGVGTVGPQSCVDAAQLGEVYATYPEAAAIVVPYKNLQEKPEGDADGATNVESETFRHYYGPAAAGCLYHDGTPRSDRACQVLANLCVLTQYDLASTPCRLYDDLRLLRAPRNSWGARSRLPWLTYARDGDAVRGDGSLMMDMAFTASDARKDHKLRFRLATYALDGTFLGFEPLTTQFFYCGLDAPRTGSGGGEASDTAWVRYGYSFRDHFSCSLPSLYGRPQRLYELYLVDADAACGAGGEAAAPVGPESEARECLYPVPVLNKALKNRDGVGVNKNGKTEDGDDDIFARRFVLYDVVSGIDTEFVDPAVTRFLVEIKLHVVGKASNPERLYVPCARRRPISLFKNIKYATGPRAL